MWIEEVKTLNKGTQYKYTERYKCPYSGKIKKVCCTLDKNSKQAQNIAYKELQAKIEKAKGFNATPRTFHEVATEWLEYTRPTLKISTYGNNELIIRRLKKYIPADRLLSKVDTITVQNILNDVYLVNNLSYRYAERHLTILKGIYKYSYRLGYINDTRFLDHVELRKKPQTEQDIIKKRLKFLDREELKTVLEAVAAKNNRIAMLLEFIALTGLRYGEAAAIRIQDYDKEAKTIYINGTVLFNYKGLHGERGTPKNIYSVRTIQLDDRCCAILNLFIIENKKSSLWSNNYKNHEGYIFIAARGHPYDISQVNKVLKSVSINGKRLTTHMFRHTHISLLTELGIPLKAIMERVGHNDPRTTLAIYAHVTKNMQTEIVNKLNAFSL